MNAPGDLMRPALAGALVGLAWLVLLVLLAPAWGPRLGSVRFASNGERIYRSATSERGTPITMSMGRMQMGGITGMAGMMACVDCHGPEGRGGTVRMMMGSFEAPDIRLKSLARLDHEPGDDHATHAPYDEASLRQAIRQGVNPDGDALEFPMPRWEMSDEDLADLVAYLKALP